MFERAITLGRIGGVPVKADPTLLLIILLVGWTFSERFAAPGRPTVTAIAMAAIAAVLFFASILAHELGHALEAKHRDMDVHGITLFLFGGVTEMRVHSSRPRDEFAIAAVGPWASLVTAAAFGLLATWIVRIDAPAARATAEVAGVLGWLNLSLAIFNLVPGAPLDGGRVLRALLWGAFGDRGRASRVAARAGQVVAGLIVVLGLFAFTGGEDVIGGLWLMFIGSFIWNGAKAELGAEHVRSILSGRTAAELARNPVPRVDADRALSFVELDLSNRPVDVALVTRDEVPVGVLRPDAITSMDPFDREIRTAGDVAESIADLPRVGLEMALEDVLELVQDHPVVAVAEDGEVMTVATIRTVAALLHDAPAPALHDLPPPVVPPPPPGPPPDHGS